MFQDDAASKSIVQGLRRAQLDWELTLEELTQLCHVPAEILASYLKGEGLGDEFIDLAKAMPLVAVYRHLTKLLPEREKQQQWLITPNELFDKYTPIQVMTMSFEHVSWVSYTLESAVRSGSREF